MQISLADTADRVYGNEICLLLPMDAGIAKPQMSDSLKFIFLSVLVVSS